MNLCRKRFRSCPRSVVWHHSFFLKGYLFVAACLMFYAAYRLLHGVMESKGMTPFTDDDLDLEPCRTTRDKHGGNNNQRNRPCDEFSHLYNLDVQNSAKDTKNVRHHLWDLDPKEREKARLFLGSYTKVHTTSDHGADSIPAKPQDRRLVAKPGLLTIRQQYSHLSPLRRIPDVSVQNKETKTNTQIDNQSEETQWGSEIYRDTESGDAETEWGGLETYSRGMEAERKKSGDTETGGSEEMGEETEAGRETKRRPTSFVPGKVGVGMVVVVEEHHDVIPYWFQAVRKGVLPPQGNVLLHIDAHADVTLAHINASFPLFRPPLLSELGYLMQRNDMFISGAALTGLFSRYIWVIPPWDTRIDKMLGPAGYRHFHVLAGVFVEQTQKQNTSEQQSSNNKKTKARTKTWRKEAVRMHREHKTGEGIGVASDSGSSSRSTGNDKNNKGSAKRSTKGSVQACYCVDVQPHHSHGMLDSFQCFVHETIRTGRSSPFTTIITTTKLILREQCRPKVLIVAEMVMERQAVELMAAATKPTTITDANNKNIINNILTNRSEQLSSNVWIEDRSSDTWIQKRSSLILDIDEDYYGVEAAITPLHDSSMTDQDVDTISETVSRVFCAEDARQESRADRVFKQLVDSVRDDLTFCLHHRCPEKTHSALETLSSKVMKELVSRALLCRRHRLDGYTLVAFLVRELFFLTAGQLRALGQVGVCLKESPRTLGFDPSKGMKVCTGHNRPGKSAVVFHSPENAEITERTGQLQTLLQRGQFTPRLITVARSVRDGYTPRGKFQRIESDVLTVLKTVYPRVATPRAILYDSQLMGGQAGWTDRSG